MRFAPELHIERGLTLDEVVEAVLAGFREGEEAAAAAGTPIRVRTLLTAMRHAARSREIAELAVAYRDRGVGGFDIAGAEAGFPPTRHLDAFEYLRRENAHFTIHAGEAFGLPSIWEALQWCGADRLGHGVRIVDDITTGDDGIAGAGPARRPTCATAASRSRCARARTCRPARPTPLRTPDHAAGGAALPGHRQHRQPADVRHVDDPRDAAASTRLRLGPDDLRWSTINAMKSAFLPFDERLEIIEHVIKPGYAALGAAH